VSLGKIQMHRTTVRRAGGWPGVGAFCVGFALIIAATVLNVAHDRLPASYIKSLPEWLSVLYKASGKFGVTLVMVSLGLAVLVLGAIYHGRSRPIKDVSDDADSTVHTSVPLYSSDPESTPAPTTTGGRMVLVTRKYLPEEVQGHPGWRTTKK
jgi:hypothetical protein